MGPRFRSFSLSIFLIALGTLGACAKGGSSSEPGPAPTPPPQTLAGEDGEHEADTAPPPAPVVHCAHKVPVFADGVRTGEICPEQAAEEGVTVLNLSDDWAPRVLAPSEYRPQLVALANEQTHTADGERVDFERYLELYGIFPSLAVLRQRAADAEVDACEQEIDDTALRELEHDVRAYAASPATWRRRRQAVGYMHHRLEEERQARSLDSIDDLAGQGPYGRLFAKYERDRRLIGAIEAAQAHLKCEGLLNRYNPGVLDGLTAHALGAFQRKHMIISSGHLDADTRQAMAAGYDELMFRAVLRVLRERVVDATALIEDGTAAAEPGTVLGRYLDPSELRATVDRGALPNGAPDLISAATEAAARALGWTSPQDTLRVLAALPEDGTAHWLVAVRLPPVPAYHSANMDLRAEIDRGDVRRRGGRARGDLRPTLVLFTTYEGRTIPLMRWNTTIGGFQEELSEDGTVVRAYKESPVGPRIWRDVIGAPSWLPLPSSPDEELLHRVPGGDMEPNLPLFGPGYRSAYGLAMVMHHKVIEPPDGEGEPRFFDEGVRTHGSVSYRSILTGNSHGCHRLFNHLAVRLTGFLIAHRHHEVRGEQTVNYQRTVHDGDREWTFRVRSRGYLYELTPPVDVEVLLGTVHGRPPPPRPVVTEEEEAPAATAPASPVSPGTVSPGTG